MWVRREPFLIVQGTVTRRAGTFYVVVQEVDIQGEHTPSQSKGLPLGTSRLFSVD